MRTFIVVLSFFIFVLLGSITAYAAPSHDSMGGYWKFDESSQGSEAADSSGDMHPATPFGTSGGPNPTTEKPTTSFPNPGSYDFNGSDQYLEVQDYEDYDDATYTVAFWARFENINSTHQTLVSKWQVGVRQQFTVQLTSGNVIGFWTGDGNGGSSGALTSVLTPSEDTWYHITAVASGTNRHLYINGTDNEYTGTGTSTGEGNIELTFGSKKNSAGTYFEFFDGQLDDIRYYSRALSEEEINALANGEHTQATWDGSGSTDFDTGSNWDINAVPDPYTRAEIVTAPLYPILTGNISLASLTLNSGTAFNANCFTVTYNDGGGRILNSASYIACPSDNTTNTSSNNSSSSDGSTGTWTCTAAAPLSAPDLFSVTKRVNAITLYFAPLSGQNTDYVVSYGLTDSADMYSMRFSEIDRLGVQKYTINSLFSGTWYVKLRGQNTCMPGAWSQVMKTMI